jgi:hypothetical protein
MADPQARVMKAIKPQPRIHQQREGDEQGGSRMAEGTRMLPVSAGVDDLKRMQHRVTDLGKQHRQTKARDKPRAWPANECERPRHSPPAH